MAKSSDCVCSVSSNDSLAEQEQGIISTISRQALRTHRPFRAIIMDKTGKPVLWVGGVSNLIDGR
jgi:hypothetical protein